MGDAVFRMSLGGRYALGLLGMAALLVCASCVVPRDPDAEVVVAAASETAPGLRGGAAVVDITPPLGGFLAGGVPYRPALKFHDPITARVVVLEQGDVRVGLVALDVIGLYREDVLRIRRAIAEEVALDYVLVAATHTHNGPETLGAWAPRPGVRNSEFLRGLPGRVADAVAEAAGSLRPVRMRVAQALVGEAALQRDTRPPELLDDALTVWQLVENDGGVVSTVVHFAAHPITVPGFNVDYSSDWPHYLRVALEEGLDGERGVIGPAGGVAVYFNGLLGGRLTPRRTEPMPDHPADRRAFNVAKAFGYRVAQSALGVLEQAVEVDVDATLEVRSETVAVPIENRLLLVGMLTGVLPRGISGGEVVSEVGRVRLGPVEWLALPGMPFPEARNGVTAVPPEADGRGAGLTPGLWAVSDVEVLVPIALSNDMLGYLIPAALWDAESPFATEDGARPYGELISPGPRAWGELVEALR